MRAFFIKAHIIRLFSVSDNKVFQLVFSQLNHAKSLVGFEHRSQGADTDGYDDLWKCHEGKKVTLLTRDGLIPPPNGLVIVQGPRGSRTRELVEHALKDEKYLFIDCKPVHETRGHSGIVKAAAKEVGFWACFVLDE
jgi:hypothetical protein